eukprot:3513028-Pleurochrysis_carterae.AAC.1
MPFNNSWPALRYVLRCEEMIQRVIFEVSDAAHRGHLLVLDAALSAGPRTRLRQRRNPPPCARSAHGEARREPRPPALATG